MQDLATSAALHKALAVLRRHLSQDATDKDLVRCLDELADLLRAHGRNLFWAALCVDKARQLQAARDQREADLRDTVRDLEDEISHNTVDHFARPSTADY